MVRVFCLIACRDTVELWRLPHQRKISLRFLAYYLLRLEIQDDLHDSIEDSWTALLLYRHYLAVKAKGYKHFHGERWRRRNG